jgi:hypothetical protein
MCQLEATRVSRWARLRSFIVGNYKAVQRSIERRSFDRKLEAIVRVALAHQSGGLAAGNRQYQLLRTHADELCANFAQRWNISPEMLEAQIPALKKLKALAEPSPKPEFAILVSPATTMNRQVWNSGASANISRAIQAHIERCGSSTPHFDNNQAHTARACGCPGANNFD